MYGSVAWHSINTTKKHQRTITEPVVTTVVHRPRWCPHYLEQLVDLLHHVFVLLHHSDQLGVAEGCQLDEELSHDAKDAQAAVEGSKLGVTLLGHPDLASAINPGHLTHCVCQAVGCAVTCQHIQHNTYKPQWCVNQHLTCNRLQCWGPDPAWKVNGNCDKGTEPCTHSYITTSMLLLLLPPLCSCTHLALSTATHTLSRHLAAVGRLT